MKARFQTRETLNSSNSSSRSCSDIACPTLLPPSTCVVVEVVDQLHEVGAISIAHLPYCVVRQEFCQCFLAVAA